MTAFAGFNSSLRSVAAHTQTAGVGRAVSGVSYGIGVGHYPMDKIREQYAASARDVLRERGDLDNAPHKRDEASPAERLELTRRVTESPENAPSSGMEGLRLPPPVPVVVPSTHSRDGRHSSNNNSNGSVSFGPKEENISVPADRILHRFSHWLRKEGASLKPTSPQTEEYRLAVEAKAKLREILRSVALPLSYSHTDLSADSDGRDDSRFVIHSDVPGGPKATIYVADLAMRRDKNDMMSVFAIVEMRNNHGENIVIFPAYSDGSIDIRAVPQDEGKVFIRFKLSYTKDENGQYQLRSGSEYSPIYTESAFVNEMNELYGRLRYGDEFDYRNGSIFLEEILREAAHISFKSRAKGQGEEHSERMDISEVVFTPLENNFAKVKAILELDPNRLDITYPARAFFTATHPIYGEESIMIELDALQGTPIVRYGKDDGGHPDSYKARF